MTYVRVHTRLSAVVVSPHAIQYSNFTNTTIKNNVYLLVL